MGTNYYIMIIIPGGGGKVFKYNICHIGHNCHLDLYELNKFFDGFVNEPEEFDEFDEPDEPDESDESEESNESEEFDERYYISRLCEKVRKCRVNATDATNFKSKICKTYDFFTGTNTIFQCGDEYDRIMSFKDILDRMSQRHSDISFKSCENAGSYVMDGIYVDQSTGFF